MRDQWQRQQPRQPDIPQQVRTIRNWLIAVAFVCFAVAGAALVISAVNLSQIAGINSVELGKPCADNLQCLGGVCADGACRPLPAVIGGPCPGRLPEGLACHGGVLTLPRAGDTCGQVGCGDGATCRDGKCQ